MRMDTRNLLLNLSKGASTNSMTNTKASILEGESILLISPHFFDYEKSIMDTIRALGGEVEYIDERPANTFLTKGLIRVNAGLLKSRIHNYYQERLASIGRDRKFSRVLVISPEAIDAAILHSIKKAYPSAEMILYMWDSMRNKTGSRNDDLIPLFDRILSFDRNDCSVIPRMGFRPLFFRNEFASLADSGIAVSHDISFVGTIHSDRYSVCSVVGKRAMAMGLNCFFHLYLSDKKLFWIYKASSPGMKRSRIHEFSFTPLPYERVVDVIAKSRCILDIQHPRQFGLTMRTIETLGARRKLLSTNRMITDYDFYNPANILCIDREAPDFPYDFIMTPYEAPSTEVYEKYSVIGWVKDILDKKTLVEKE